MALNFADLFEHAADAFPDRPAVICGAGTVTYRQLEARVNRLAHYLAACGVRPGEHVGVYGRNSIEVVETLLAACKIRAAAININYRYVENELQYMLVNSDAVLLVHDQELAPRVAAVAAAAPRLTGTVMIEDGSGAPVAGAPVAGAPVAGAPVAGAPAAVGAVAGVPETGAAVTGTTYRDALAAGSPERDFPPRSADDVYVIYTGGTTGYPKGVMWRHEDIWRTLGGGIDFVTGEPLADEWEQSRRGQAGGLVSLSAAPLIHGSAMVTTLMSLFSGNTIVLMTQFDPREIWRAVGQHQVNTLMVIGDAMARPLIDAYAGGRYDASSLLALSSNAALFSPAVKQACAAALPNVVITEAIGSTETGFAGLAFVTKDAPQRGGPTVTPGPEVIVLDEAGGVAGPGHIGRLARGGHVPLGYYNDPARTAAMFTEVGGKRYAVPGDLARVEADGSVTLLGRGNTCVNSGGEKIFPEEVEGALKSHPDVFDTLVIGVPDERLGQRVAALVQPREGRTPDLADLVTHVRQQLAGYKVPRSIWLVGAIGRTAAGKADYHWAHRYAVSHPPAAGPPAAGPPAAGPPAAGPAASPGAPAASAGAATSDVPPATPGPAPAGRTAT